MFNNKKVVVVLLVYNVEKIFEKIYNEIFFYIVDEVILVDDCSMDVMVRVVEQIGVKYVILYDVNCGYGGNQKMCYNKCKELKVDIVVMLYLDYQYILMFIEVMFLIIVNGVYLVVFGFCIFGKGVRKGGMLFYKYIFNCFLILFQNIFMGQKLLEYYIGFWVFYMDVFNDVDYEKCLDDFVFDNQIIVQIFIKNYEIVEVICLMKYFFEVFFINFKCSVIYGLYVFGVFICYFFYKNWIV